MIPVVPLTIDLTGGIIGPLFRRPLGKRSD